MTLLEEIAAAPDDDVPRSVFADYLLEISDPWGEFIHLQLALAKGGDTLRPTHEPRIRELFDDHHRRRRPEGKRGQWVWRRGFIDHLATTATDFRLHGAKLFELAPLLRILETPVGPIEDIDAFVQLLESPGMARLEGLIVRASLPVAGAIEYLDEDEVEDYVPPPVVTNDLGDEAIELLTSVELPRLHMLGISRLTSDGLGMLARSPLAARLDRLVAPWLTAHELRSYLDHPNTRPLRGLVCAELIDHPKLARLEEVSTLEGPLSPVGIRRSIRSGGRWDGAIQFDDWTFRPCSAF